MGETEKTAGRVVSIDTGKRQSYAVVEEHGKIIKEGYTETSKEGFGRFLTNGDTMIIETSSCFNGILDMIENYGELRESRGGLSL